MRVSKNTKLHLIATVVAAAIGTAVLAGIGHAQTTGGRLDSTRLRACQNRENAINRLMGSMANRAHRQLDLFSTITTRVQTFYTEKGRTVADYDALVDAVNVKKSEAVNQVTQILHHATLNCADSNPKGPIQLFLTQLHTTNAALKEYRTAVKNLIVGVRAAQGQSASNTNASNANSANTNG
jgi:hypothetical protein